MPRFHFNFRKGDQVVPDLEGQELPDTDAVRELALASARETLINSIKCDDDPPDCIQVTDGDGKEVLIVYLAEVLPKSMRK